MIVNARNLFGTCMCGREVTLMRELRLLRLKHLEMFKEGITPINKVKTNVLGPQRKAFDAPASCTLHGARARE